jgi:Tol biopolymer transport system component
VTDAALMQVSAAGGTPQRLIAHQGGGVAFPEYSPDGRVIVYSVQRAGTGPGEIHALAVDSGESRLLPFDGEWPHLLGGTHLVFEKLDRIWAVGFDSPHLRVVGEPVPLVDGVDHYRGAGRSAGPKLGTARDGSIFFVSAATSPRNTVVWVDSEGREEALPLLPNNYNQIRVSPTFDRFALGTDRTNHVWVFNPVNGATTRLVPRLADDRYPLWALDGRRILFTSNTGGEPAILSVSVDGTGEPEPVFTPPTGATDVGAEDWTPDGQSLVFYEARNGQTDIGVLPASGRGPAQMQFRPEGNEGNPRISPDGRWVAYHSNVSGRFETYIERFPQFTDRVQVSSGGGRSATWSADGSRIFYVTPNGRQLFEVEVRTGPMLHVGTPRLRSNGQYLPVQGAQRSIDRGPDGRLAILKPLADSGLEAKAGQLIFLEHSLQPAVGAAP